MNNDDVKTNTQPEKPAAKPMLTAIAKPQSKEVKTMAVKDPKGMFDYTGCQSYEVKDGDDLLAIAQNYKVAIQQLRYFNHLDKDFTIRPGQTLYVPKEPINVPVGE